MVQHCYTQDLRKQVILPLNCSFSKIFTIVTIAFGVSCAINFAVMNSLGDVREVVIFLGRRGKSKNYQQNWIWTAIFQCFATKKTEFKSSLAMNRFNTYECVINLSKP
jgi:hypothetical protein